MKNLNYLRLLSLLMCMIIGLPACSDDKEKDVSIEDGTYKPYDGHKIGRIIMESDMAIGKSEQTYSYQYDVYGRISRYSLNRSKGSYMLWSCQYEYNNEKVIVTITEMSENSPVVLIGYWNQEGYIKRVEYSDKKKLAEYYYNNEGYLVEGQSTEGVLSIEYDKNWNPIKIQYPVSREKWSYSYTKGPVNNSNLDLNKLVTFKGRRLNVEHIDVEDGLFELFGQFGFLGKRSSLLLDKESDGKTLDRKYECKVDKEYVTTIIETRGINKYTYKVHYTD